MWFIEFYSPRCKYCKKLIPAWNEAAERLDGVIKFGAVDMSIDREVGMPYDMKGFPTLKFFGRDKNTPLTYNGQRDT